MSEPPGVRTARPRAVRTVTASAATSPGGGRRATRSPGPRASSRTPPPGPSAVEPSVRRWLDTHSTQMVSPSAARSVLVRWKSGGPGGAEAEPLDVEPPDLLEAGGDLAAVPPDHAVGVEQAQDGLEVERRVGVLGGLHEASSTRRGHQAEQLPGPLEGRLAGLRVDVEADHARPPGRPPRTRGCRRGTRCARARRRAPWPRRGRPRPRACARRARWRRRRRRGPWNSGRRWNHSGPLMR